MSNLAHHIDPEHLDAARAHATASQERTAAFLAANPEAHAARERWARANEPKKDYALGADGTIEFEFDSLAEFADTLWSGATIRRVGFSADSWTLHYFGLPSSHRTRLIDGSPAGGDGPPFDLEREGENAPDSPHNWILCEDTRWRAPETIATRSEAVAFAERWRESHRSLLAREVAAFVSPGCRVVFALWVEPAVLAAEARAIVRTLDDSAEPRFLPVGFPYTIPDVPDDLGWSTTSGIYLPAEMTASNVVTLADRRAKALASTPASGPVLRTAFAGLDRQFHPHVGGGFPLGSLVVLGGRKGAAKTTLALHLAEQARAAGFFVLWVAKDEQVPKIEQRLKQYRGETLDPPDFYVLPLGSDCFEDLAEQAVAEAGGRPVFVVADSLQRMVTRTSAGRSGEAKITAIVEAIAAVQERHPMIVVATSEIARGSNELKGSSSIDYLGTTCLLLVRAGNVVSVSYLKNRDGGEEPFRLMLDQAGQRLTEAGASAGRDVGAGIIAAVAELAPEATGAAIEEHIGGDCKAVRKALAALVEVGLIVKTGAARATRYSVKPATE